MKAQTTRYRLINYESFLILLFVTLVIAAFFPIIYNDVGLYRYVKYMIFGVLALLVLKTRVYNALGNKNIIISLVLVFFLSLQLMIFFSVGFHVRWNDVTGLMIVVMLMSVGYCCQVDERQVELFVLVFAVFAIVAGVWSMLYYVGRLSMNTYLYAVEAKNQIGQFVASAAAGVFFLLFSNKRLRAFKIGLLVLLVILLFVLRCRTALLAFLVFAVYYYFKSHHVRNLFFVLLVAVLLLLVFSGPVLSFLEDVFVGNKDINDLNSVSSNRMERNIEGLRFWNLNPVFGEMKTPSEVLRIHNYLINILSAYGLFAFLFYVLFFYLLVVVVKKWKRINALNVSSIGYWVMFIPFFCSLLEPSAPYGPGLVQAVPIFLFGISMRMIKIKDAQVNEE